MPSGFFLIKEAQIVTANKWHLLILCSFFLLMIKISTLLSRVCHPEAHQAYLCTTTPLIFLASIYIQTKSERGHRQYYHQTNIVLFINIFFNKYSINMNTYHVLVTMLRTLLVCHLILTAL